MPMLCVSTTTGISNHDITKNIGFRSRALRSHRENMKVLFESKRLKPFRQCQYHWVLSGKFLTGRYSEKNIEKLKPDSYCSLCQEAI